jgi:hypothetical protein
MSRISFIQGSYNIQVMRLSVDGLAMGTALNPNSVTAGTSLPAYIVEHPVSLGSLRPSRELATDRGGQRIRGQRDLGASDLGTLEMVMSDYDMGFDAVVSGSVVNDTTIEGFTQGAPNLLQERLPQVAILFTAGAQSRDDDEYGTDKQLAQLFIGTVAGGNPSASQSGGVNPNPMTYTLTPTVFATLPNGVTLESLNLGYSENIVHHMITTDYLYVYTYVAAGADTEITLPYLPLYTDNDGSTYNWITENGVTAGVTSISATTGIVVIPSATALDTWVFIYPTAFVPSPTP